MKSMKKELKYLALSLALLVGTSATAQTAPNNVLNFQQAAEVPVGSELGGAEEVTLTRPGKIFEQMAGIFSSFVNESANYSDKDNISSASSIGKSLESSAKHIHIEAIDGAKALALLAAFEVEEFTNGIIDVAKYEGKEVLVQKLIEDPHYVNSFAGYETAKNRASGYLGWALSRSKESSTKLTKFSYDSQKLGWAKVAGNTQARLDAIAISWDSPNTKYQFNISNLGSSNVNVAIGDRILAASALVALGHESEAMEMMKIGGGKSCAKLAYLNLRQCVAATKFPFEQTFCMAKHSIDEYQGCIEKGLK